MVLVSLELRSAGELAEEKAGMDLGRLGVVWSG
jgi:hypothetical protein